MRICFFDAQIGAALAYFACGHPIAGLISAAVGVYVGWVQRNALWIRDAEGDYLTRYHLITLSPLLRWLGISLPREKCFLHRIWRADKDRDVHNHPWPKAHAFVLWGGYSELIWYPIRYQDISREIHSYGYLNKFHGLFSLSFEAFKPENYHRIVFVLPNTWTLFFAGRRDRDWGFLTPEGHVPSRKYLGLPDDHDFGD